MATPNQLRLQLNLTARNLATPVVRQALQELQRETSRLERLNDRAAQRARVNAQAQIQAAQAASHAQRRAADVAANAQIQAQQRITAANNAAARIQIENARRVTQAQRQAAAAALQAARAAQAAQAARDRALLSTQQHNQRLIQMQQAHNQKLQQMAQRHQERLREIAARGQGGGAGGAGGPMNLNLLAAPLNQLATAVRWVVLYQAVRSVVDLIGQIPATMLQMNIETENATAVFRAMQGSAQAAAATVEMLRTNARETGTSMIDMIRTAQTLFPQFGKDSTKLQHSIGTAQILAAMNPIQGLQGAAFALAEAESGDYISMRERFRMSLSDKNQLLAEGFSGGKLVDEWLRRIGVDYDIVLERQNTFAGQWDRLTANAQEFLRILGFDAFQELKSGLMEFNTLLNGNEEDIQRLAQAWSESLGKTMRETITWLKENGPQTFEDIKNAARDIVAIINAITWLPRTLQQASDANPLSWGKIIRWLLDRKEDVVVGFERSRRNIRNGSGGYAVPPPPPGKANPNYAPALADMLGVTPLRELDYSAGARSTLPITPPVGHEKRAPEGLGMATMTAVRLEQVSEAARRASKSVTEYDKALQALAERGGRYSSAISDIKEGIKEMERQGMDVPEWMREALKIGEKGEGRIKIQVGMQQAAILLAERNVSALGSAVQAIKDLSTQDMRVNASTVVINGAVAGSSGGGIGSAIALPYRGVPYNPSTGVRSFHTGSTYVPEDGLYRLAAGEAVLNRDEVRQGSGSVTFIDARQIRVSVSGEERPAEKAELLVRSVGRPKYDLSRSGHGALGSF